MNKKAIYVVRVNNYFPELCELTIPRIKAYAHRIGADYIEITEQKYAEWSPLYEKMQIHELGKNYEWNILIDADYIIHPQAPDFTLGLDPSYVGVMYAFPADVMFKHGMYFKRDGRNLGLSGQFMITSQLTHDLWIPFEFGVEEAKDWMNNRSYINFDELCMSRNLARYGLKFTGLEYNQQIKYFFVHLSLAKCNKDEVIARTKTIIESQSLL